MTTAQFRDAVLPLMHSDTKFEVTEGRFGPIGASIQGISWSIVITGHDCLDVAMAAVRAMSRA